MENKFTGTVELLTDLETLIHQFPNDIEAKAFLVVRLWQFSRQGLPITSPIAVNSLLKEVFATSPNHPAHHYAIHLWDRKKADRALHAAHFADPDGHLWSITGWVDVADCPATPPS